MRKVQVAVFKLLDFKLIWNMFKFYSPGKQRQIQHGNQKAYESTSVHSLSKVQII